MLLTCVPSALVMSGNDEAGPTGNQASPAREREKGLKNEDIAFNQRADTDPTAMTRLVSVSVDNLSNIGSSKSSD